MAESRKSLTLTLADRYQSSNDKKNLEGANSYRLKNASYDKRGRLHRYTDKEFEGNNVTVPKRFRRAVSAATAATITVAVSVPSPTPGSPPSGIPDLVAGIVPEGVPDLTATEI